MSEQNDTPQKAAPQPTQPIPRHSSGIDRLRAVMACLRDPHRGCPWDIEQTFATIAPYTIEEAYEVAEAIRNADMGELCDELGDLLLQVVYHAQMASEDGQFDFDDVAAGCADKMIRRHPHVFADERVTGADAQTVNWERQKADERARKARAEGRDPSALDDLSLGLPALMRASKLSKRAARTGFDWPEAEQVFAKIDEEIGELRQEIARGDAPEAVHEEMGDLLFTVANLARKLDVDPETALRDANAKFERRFREVERRVAAEGRRPQDCSLDELEAHWQAGKRSAAAD
ncbi:nucleoside triphosphate pyrophosphohydrolase [Rhodovibrio salinarum]|uniref:Nucleoside triphosphate pyrophosphohydrolase n=2 Tax=Rhodovibrio salinarum TaxID=1087 RepID=A0A934QJH8_9PROT|nr:nucleoside triphosphate pyrophosphohydrolase [Rhodovibrio salinarum]